MTNQNNKILIVDLEATCWKSTVPKGEVNEIIEIGICILDIKTGEITKNKGILVQPKHSRVSSFCTELTTITQELLDKEGVSFQEACAILRKEYNAHQYPWASYGAYDLRMLKNQCMIRNIDFPMSQNHINVKELFTEKKGLKKKVGMNGALQLLKTPLEGTHHRGVDDAKNIATILHWCFCNGSFL